MKREDLLISRLKTLESERDKIAEDRDKLLLDQIDTLIHFTKWITKSKYMPPQHNTPIIFTKIVDDYYTSQK